ncbi:MAG: methionyl-tRNA formyltransferase [Proteobacteria bacterium]|nr:methionyl-tRNA formyltransferase [Pseudomonadota bacterium]
MGSPDFAVPALRGLIEHHDVALVMTQPDKRAGRGKRVTAPAVKEVALQAGIPVMQPSSARPPEIAAKLAESGAELGVVVAYGKILPQAVLEAFPRGCINIHGSILPRYRGAAPIQWSIIQGETETGVTIMQLDEGMDTGPMLLVRKMAVEPDDSAGSLATRMAPVGAEAMLEVIDGLAAGTIEPVEQDHSAATYAPMLKKEDGIVDWTQSARQVADRIRGVDPWPGAETSYPGSGSVERLKLFGPTVIDSLSGRPGQVLGVDERGLIVACGRGACAVATLQAPGRRRMPANTFVSGRPIPEAAIMGGPLDDGSNGQPPGRSTPQDRSG